MTEPRILEIHSHSTVSDGAYPPEKLADLLEERGVEMWSLTDHDNVSGSLPAAAAAAERGIEFVTGVEISARVDETSVHVLGYGFDPDDERLGDYGTEMVIARENRMKGMIQKLADLGFEVDFEDVQQIAGGGNVGRPHLAKALLERGHVDEFQEAFDRFIENGGPAYVALARPSVVESIEMIIDAGGIAVLAHPARYGDVSGHLDRWKNAGLWGLEVRHPSHTPEDEGRLKALAEQHGLAMTASNDWHGNEEGDLDVLGNVDFPDQWRRAFLEALESTTWW